MTNGENGTGRGGREDPAPRSRRAALADAAGEAAEAKAAAKNAKAAAKAAKDALVEATAVPGRRPRRELPRSADDDIEPPWWRGRRSRNARAPLSREAIVDAAVHILDAEGVDALTIRRLGQELGTGAASLYWHIAGKEELGELVYDRLMGEVELPELDPDNWQQQLKEVARDSFRVMRSHNDAVRLSLGRIPAGPNMLRMMDWLLGLLGGAGLPDKVAAYFGDLLGRYIDASVLEEEFSAAGAADTEDAVAAMRDFIAGLPPQRFPHLVAASAAMFTHADSDERFELGLEILIRGLESYVTDRPADSGRRRGSRSRPS